MLMANGLLEWKMHKSAFRLGALHHLGKTTQPSGKSVNF